MSLIDGGAISAAYIGILFGCRHLKLEPHPPILVEREVKATNPIPATKQTYLHNKIRGKRHKHQKRTDK